MDDEEMLRKISKIEFIAKEIRYHRFCRTEYQARAKEKPKGKEEMNRKEPMETNLHIEREVYSQAFESIKEFAQVNIIIWKKCIV